MFSMKELPVLFRFTSLFLATIDPRRGEMQIAICEVLLERHAALWLGDFPFTVLFAILRSEERGWFTQPSHSITAPII